MTSQEIRQKYLDFFEKNGHLIVPSAPIVLKDDPSLMFSNSGMTQFKDYFLGYKKPGASRIADTQKCLRVSGKHNDLDDVGRDTYHHTMFEMLGNWSFGDYFKKEAIEFAWKLLTEEYQIPKENLYVTIFEGDASENLERDQQAFDLWKQFIPEERIINGNKKDNFWEMGESGPCGPCSEIHVDLRSEEEKSKVPGIHRVNQDDPQVIEIWNLVFMEFNRKADGSLEKLPQQHVDTGMGFERLCMALQGKQSNYDTDVFSPLISKVEELTGKTYTAVLEDEKDIAIRVVVDHIRAVAFAIADGQLPSNGGAGYVIRRILRRAISYAYRFLGVKEPMIYHLVNVLNEQMGETFPELSRQKSLVEGVVFEEETSFLRTIETGLVRLNSIIESTKNTGEKHLPGAQVFELYDTFGFPADLSRIIAEESGLSVDEVAFEEEMQKQRQRSKQDSAQKVEDWNVISNQEEDFVGYDHLTSQTHITRYRKITNKDGEFYQIVLAATPFYPEGGGQIGDRGYITQDTTRIPVLSTRKENNLILSFVEHLPKDPSAPLIAEVDPQSRANAQANHTATHLLHEALREVLGTHVEQKGSFVGTDYLRFDFSHFAKLSPEEIHQVEKKVNERIRQNLTLEEFRNIPLKEAMQKGAMALFGEKYGDTVRMIQFGTSKELCGGTHVQNTSQIGRFRILSETSAAAGIRRIEAVTAEKAEEYYTHLETQINEITQLLKSKDIKKTLEKLLEENTQLKAEVENFKKEKAISSARDWKKDFIQKEGYQLLVKQTQMPPATLKDLAFELKREVPDGVIVLLSDFGAKPNITVATGSMAEKTHPAAGIIRNLTPYIQGGGGGNPGFATAGGKNLQGLATAFDAAQDL